MNFSWKFYFSLIIAIALGTAEINSQEANTPSSLACSGAGNCETCVRDSACFWCETKLQCKVYGVGSKEAATKDCGKWKWKSCEKSDSPLVPIISAVTSVVLICVLVVFICIKQDLWSRMKSSRFCNRWDREGMFEQEERLNRKRKHRRTQSHKAQKFAAKYQLSDTEIFLYSP